MKIIDQLKRVFNRNPKNLILRDSYISSDLNIGCLKFAEVCYYNILHILTSLIDDVDLKKVGKKTDALEVAYFKRFISLDGQFILDQLYDQGYSVIKLPTKNSPLTSGYHVMNRNEYNITTTEGTNFKITPINCKDDEIYVLKSDTFRELGISDKQLLYPILKYIDNLLNSSNTLTERLGTLIVASPKNLNNAPTSIVLTEEDKNELEEEMSKQYGSLRNQKQILLLPREMSFENINLSGVDQKLEEKLKIGLEIIADRLKVPANKIAVIDASSSKALSNGSELIAGDSMLYKSFERLLNHTIIRMADDLGIKIDYTIYNKPINNTGELDNGQN